MTHHASPPNRSTWPKVRLYVTPDLASGQDVTLDKEQSHYITSVMRKGSGDAVRLFNGRDGEWQATITQTSKKNVILTVSHQLRPQEASPDVWLLFAPIKKSGTDMILQKATELGARRLIPVRTRFSESQRINLDRFHSITIEAAEQSERLDIPLVDDIKDLDKVMETWPTDRPLFMADEQGGAALTTVQGLTEPRAALIGPEGGFAPEDHRILDRLTSCHKVSLGPRILRAETAALVLLSHLTLT